MNDRSPRTATLSRREWALVALGLCAWILIAAIGVWFVHQLTRPKASCGNPVEARSTRIQGASPGPRSTLQWLTGTGTCP
jgi:hypothetical protein